MELLTTSEFVDNLPVLNTFHDAILKDNYTPIPQDWFVAVTDVVKSQDAIAAGRYREVNMAGVAMITAIMNELEHQKIPYIFAGDGAAVAFAPNDYDLVHDALARTRGWVSDKLSLELRAAIVPVSEIRKAKCDIKIAGLYVSHAITNYAFIGKGVTLSDKLMKQGEYEVVRSAEGEYPNLTGLSCRWMPVEKQGTKIISMIVEAHQGCNDIPTATLEKLLHLVSADEKDGHPAPEERIKFKWPVDGLELEAKASGDSKFKLYIISLLALVLDKTGWRMGEFDPTHYRKQLAMNTDYRKIQDGLRMTLSLEYEKVKELKAFLEKERSAGHLSFGLSEQDKAVLTCFVPSITSDDHYHFLDGAGGGYAAAASDLH